MRGAGRRKATIDIEKLEKLAAIELTEEERVRFQKELQTILDYFSQIDEVDTEGVEVTYHEHLGFQRMREDEPERGLDKEDALKNAPEREGDYFKIPPILE